MTEWKPFWDVNQPRRDLRKSTKFCGYDVEAPAPLPLDACEFAGSLVDESCDGRICVDGAFCPSRLFGNPAIYASCPTRLEKLKTKKDQP
jgi:hypothetical protein